MGEGKGGGFKGGGELLLQTAKGSAGRERRAIPLLSIYPNKMQSLS